MGYIIPICSKEIYEIVSNKYRFYCLCKEHGIPVPRELERHDSLHPPFVVKPKTYFARKSMRVNPKPILVHRIESKELIQNLLASGEVFIQEFVEGRSIYLLFYFGKDEFIEFTLKRTSSSRVTVVLLLLHALPIFMNQKKSNPSSRFSKSLVSMT